MGADLATIPLTSSFKEYAMKELVEYMTPRQRKVLVVGGALLIGGLVIAEVLGYV